MKKIYISDLEKLNDYEKKYMKASFRRLVDCYIENLVLCNRILELDENIYCNIQVGKLNENKEIYQAYIINDLHRFDLESLQDLLKENNANEDLIISYSDMLDCYVLLVTHCGTSWDYVLTDVDLTLDINEI